MNNPSAAATRRETSHQNSCHQPRTTSILSWFLIASGEAHDSGVCPQRARCSGRRASVQRPSVLVSQVGASVRS